MITDFGNQEIRVRFAPSPTGHLHIGGLRTALFNWLFARKHGGSFLIRIEDTDVERSRQEYTASIFAALKWVDLEPDYEPVIQSQRLEEHKKLIQKLIDEGKAYRCYCTQKEIDNRAKEKHGDQFAFAKYDGWCRKNKPSDTDNSFVIRFALPTDKESITFGDLVRGEVTFPLDQFDDFIIARSDGRPMYNFVVVVDDAFMKITQVIRGEDHISNTPKQIMLYQACGFPVPQFAHLPLILGPSGDRLSKRDAATSVLDYKHNGYLPDALLNYLARLGWSHGDQEIFRREELIKNFSLEGVGKKGAIFDVEKLNWVNSTYLHALDAQDILNYIHVNLDPLFARNLSESCETDSCCSGPSGDLNFEDYVHLWTRGQVCIAIDLYKERSKTITALMSEVILLHNGPTEYNQDDVEKWVTSKTSEYLSGVINTLESIDTFEKEEISSALKECARSFDIKLVALLQPIRIALIGRAQGPGVFDMITLLGKQETSARITLFLESLVV